MGNAIFFRVVTRNDGTSWVYRDNKPYCGPFTERPTALRVADDLATGVEAYPDAHLRPSPSREA
jgi:hypothetical protein